MIDFQDIKIGDLLVHLKYDFVAFIDEVTLNGFRFKVINKRNDKYVSYKENNSYRISPEGYYVLVEYGYQIQRA